ncbi:hypothetical protein GALMADRAFT_157339 [Galerina marginata CBS 339.88]|uniref:MalT-like TPR region domain-containing protein n=1 Tax=Galerina marginata (strain CBS 339.88) TaxID=685588 RepID=A0A067SXF5_GALM3|nr:hypothetical protein GALMADRAFT_157339 [Galerina marginata CBS 339.88]
MTYGQEPDGLDVKGIEFLTSARDMFKNLGDSLNHAKCTYFLEQIYYWAERYDEALTIGRAAVKEHEDIGQYAGDPMMILGRALFMKEMYQNALETFVRTLEICKSYGRPADIAQALEMIGRTWARLDRKADAQGVYAEAMRYYGAIQMEQGQQDIMRCRFLIRQAEDPLLVPTDEEREALLVFYNGF